MLKFNSGKFNHITEMLQALFSKLPSNQYRDIVFWIFTAWMEWAIEFVSIENEGCSRAKVNRVYYFFLSRLGLIHSLETLIKKLSALMVISLWDSLSFLIKSFYSYFTAHSSLHQKKNILYLLLSLSERGSFSILTKF